MTGYIGCILVELVMANIFPLLRIIDLKNIIRRKSYFILANKKYAIWNFARRGYSKTIILALTNLSLRSHTIYILYPKLICWIWKWARYPCSEWNNSWKLIIKSHYLLTSNFGILNFKSYITYIFVLSLVKYF